MILEEFKKIKSLSHVICVKKLSIKYLGSERIVLIAGKLSVLYAHKLQENCLN